MTSPSAPEREQYALSVTRTDSLRLLTSPLRNDMLVTLLGSGPSSVTQLAAWLDRPASSLYFHMDKLEQAGLVERVAMRRKERHEEVLYAAVGCNLAIPHDDPDPRLRKLRGQVAAVGLSRVAELVEEALTEGRDTLADGQPSVGSMRSAAWLDEHQLSRLRSLSLELRALISEAGTPAPDKTPIQLSLAYVALPHAPGEDD